MSVAPQHPTEQRVQRYDAGLLRPSHTTDEGFLVCEAFVARPGVYEYIQPDGSVVRELIPEEELHRADSLGTLALKPVTLEHPPEDVTPDNYDRYAVGEVGNEISVVEGGYVKVIMVAKRRDAINALRNGVKETSPGYSCRIEKTSGVDPRHGPFDQIQRDRRYNHKAITERARGGPTIHARVDGATITAPVRGAYQRRTDSLFAELPAMGAKAPTKRKDTMDKEEMKRLMIEVLADQSKRQDADDKYDALSKKVDKLATAVDGLMKSKSKKDDDGEEEEEEGAADKKDKKKDSAPDFRKLYNERKRLEALATTHRIDSKKVESLDNPELAKEIVLAANPKARKDGDARYYMDALDFIEQQGESPRADSDFADPYKQLGDSFGDEWNDNGQRRQDGGQRPPSTPSQGWADRVNQQFKERHAR